MNQTSSKPFRILAVAPSTRGFGFAVMEGEKTIIECAGRVADGDKNAESISKLEKLLKFYQPDALILQDVEVGDSRRSPRIRKLNRNMQTLGRKQKIQVELISGRQTRSLLLGDPGGTKRGMAERLAALFPAELAFKLPPKRKPWDSEDARMDLFDAMSLAMAFWEYN